MEETRDDPGSAEQRPSNSTWWPSDFIEKFGSVSLDSKNETLSTREANNYIDHDRLLSQTASQILWSTGMLTEPIPNGFYSVIPETRLKELFEDIPTLDELYALGVESLRADIILVDTEKDKKLSMLKQLIVALVKGMNSNPAAMIKKIAALVSDFYKRPNLELSPVKAALEESSHAFENRGVQILGQIKHGSCRPRAILFKVLADTVGLESTLMVGLPNEGAVECADSYKHMSVIVMLNSMELLVDLMRFPGQLIPRSTKAMYMTHISAAGESDSAENDSCDSPLEPNSPLYGFSERVDPESTEKDEGFQYKRRLESASNVAGPALRNMMLRPSTLVDRKLSVSHSEPNIATSFCRRSRRKVIAEQRTASSRWLDEVIWEDDRQLNGTRPPGVERERVEATLEWRERERMAVVGVAWASHDRGTNPGGPYALLHACCVASWVQVFSLAELHGASVQSSGSVRVEWSHIVVGSTLPWHYNAPISLLSQDFAIRLFLWEALRAKPLMSWRKAIALFNPEHPSFRARARSMLGGDRKLLRDYADDIATSSYRSEGASTSETHRIRRRSISITPEIGDDIARAVRAMSETLKQNRLLREQGDDGSFPYSSNDRNIGSDHQKNVSDFDHDDRDQVSGGRSQMSSDYKSSDETVSTWHKVLELPMFQNKPLLPFQEWNIDYRELTVGTRVGIGFFGEVFRGIWNGTDVAIKVFLEQDLTAENMEDFCNEISILSRLRHPNGTLLSLDSGQLFLAFMICPHKILHVMEV
ncbi:mitogen activated protein kinase kinase kinase-like protein [Actinidia rufa]|uniref:Mitogen activated protein kinase kinase kinase-like protein n=1 Tax=Actinidia rufa TaxID=165716 RepID=A0A7J0DFN8_9ERIC|nr:mitogen activated protein kinase kinase kinase-like protein [Actinidia rufa]